MLAKGGMGPSGLITKIDRAITALKFVKFHKTELRDHSKNS